MARKLNEKPSIPPDRISAELVRETVDVIREKKQDLSDAQMAHAGEYKAAEKKGMHTKALKLATVMAKEEPHKRLAFWKHLTHYVGSLGLDQDPQRKLFADDGDMPSAQDVANAVGEINMLNSGPDLSTIPNPPPPADFEGKKRKIGAWAKGCEARRNGEKRSDCLLTGAESVAIFEQAWDAMDASIKAAAEGGQPASGTCADVGSDLPEGMSQDEHTALLAEGIKLFREGKAPGAHAYGDDPVKAGIVMKGWATEQDAQNAARAAERAAEQAAEGGGQQIEQALSAEEVQALEAEGATACEAGDPQSACPHPAGSAKADAWLAGWERQDDALFDEAGPAAVEAPGESGEVVFADADDGDELPDLPEDDDADVLMPAMASNGAADAFMAPAE
ncbi:ribosome modulation factor [Azospirillum aestuarii]|uniref:ribosome modulation factor n=1 Tax=Azospirillum aestuarii TaxID=2802052 RepID=UPI004054F0F6